MIKIFYGLFFLFLINLNSFGQNEGLKVEYNEFYDTDYPVEMKGFLYTLPSSSSIYETDLSTKQKIKNNNQTLENHLVIEIPPLVVENDFFIIDLKENIVESFDYLYENNKSKILDAFKMNWEFINEKRTIDKIECYKAETNFRGRKWIAWYAPSIPYSVGPDKFHGLPGLIIQLNDETGEYNYLAQKIEFLNKESYDKKLKEVQSITYNQIQTKREFVEKREQIIAELFESLDTERGFEVRREKKTRNGRELKYEWEE